MGGPFSANAEVSTKAGQHHSDITIGEPVLILCPPLVAGTSFRTIFTTVVERIAYVEG
jgi:hypothetical protein